MRIVTFSGWRYFSNRRFIEQELERFDFEHASRPIIEKLIVRVGDCPTGVDKFIREWGGWQYCSFLAGGKPIVYQADWDRYGMQAGPIRNINMLKGQHPEDTQELAHELIAYPEPDKPIMFPGSGTWGCVSSAFTLGVTVTLPGYVDSVGV
jgi:hypothetical protein